METLGEEGLGDRSHLGLVTPELVHRVGADPPISSAFRFSLPGSFVVKYKAERINITICCKVPGFEGNECRIWKCRIFNPRISPEIGDSEALSKKHPFANSLLRKDNAVWNSRSVGFASVGFASVGFATVGFASVGFTSRVLDVTVEFVGVGFGVVLVASFPFKRRDAIQSCRPKKGSRGAQTASQRL